MRQCDNGVLITAPPAEGDGRPAAWQLRLRLRTEDNGRGLNDLGAALATGRRHGICADAGPGFETLLVFLPHHPAEGVGTLARVRTGDGPEDDVTFERRVERPMGLWATAGESLRRIVPVLGPDAPPAYEPDA